MTNTRCLITSINIKIARIHEMREFVNRTLALNYAALASNKGVNRKEVELVINQIVLDVSGVEPSEIAPHKKFGYDLGID